jgi:hypothetical protein
MSSGGLSIILRACLNRSGRARPLRLACRLRRGPTRSEGPIGPLSAQRDTGAPSPVGPIGPPGAQGAQGMQGLPGATVSKVILASELQS